MTFDLRKFSPPSVLALCLGKTAAFASSLRHGGEAPEPLRIPIAAEEVLADPAKAGAKLTQALAQAGLNGFRTAVCLPPSWVLSTSADLPEVSDADLHGYFELRAEREFSLPDLCISHGTYRLPGSGARRATLAALPSKHLGAILTFLKTAGCNPVSISLDLPGCLDIPAPTLHLLCGKTTLEAIISLPDGIAALRTLSNDPATLGRELRITLGRLPESVRASVHHARILGPVPPLLPELLEKLGLAAAVDETGPDGASAKEAARRILAHLPIPFEFYTPAPNRWEAIYHRFNTKHGRQSIAAAAALVFLPVLIFSYRAHKEKSLQREWEGMRENVAELNTIQQKIRQFRPWFDPAPQKLQIMKTVAAAFPERGELWARSIQISPYITRTENGSRSQPSLTASTVTINAFSQNNAAMMALQGTLSKQPGVSELQLKQLRGNNPIQFSLTFKWEPLHD